MESAQSTKQPAGESSPLSDDLFAGTNYRTLSRIGAGGMGEVFVVEHRELGRDFVGKVLHAELASDPRVVDRMRVERQSLGRLNHPNIVSVVDSSTLKDGRPFMIMERLRGRTLAQELRERGKLPVYEAVRFTCELLSALAATHEIGIVHRDIKPANLFICALPDGSRHLKVLDFGVARIMPNAPAAAPMPLILPTDVGVLMGTPRFASPEAAVGCRVDARADLYAAALMLYMMLSGRGPFDHVAEVLAAHVRDDPAPPSKYASDPVPYPLDKAVLRGLKKDPRERFQTALEFMAELESTVALLRRPLGWVETTLFPDADVPSEPAGTESISEATPNDSSLDGTTFRLPLADASPKPEPARPVEHLDRKLPSFLLPFVLGMLVAGVLAVVVTAVVGH